MARGTILVIDDDGDIVDALRDQLVRAGHRVLSAHDGLSALRVLAAETVELILLDLLMPAMSGWELLDATAGDPRLATIPVIVLSAAPSDVLPSERVHAVLQKPFDGRALLALIGQVRAATVATT